MGKSRTQQEFLDALAAQNGRLRRLCRYYGRTKTEEDDLYQEMCMQLWRAWSGFRGEAKLSTWMYRVALNTALMFRRSAGRRPLPADAQEAQDLPTPHDTASEVDAAERRAWLQRAVDQLNELDRQLILLLLEGMSYQEMADITGISISNVGVRLNRAKKQLATLMPNFFQPDP